MKATPSPQYTPEQQALIATWLRIGRQNPWIRKACDPPFAEHSFHICTDVRELAVRIFQGNWCLGQAFALGDICFINQVDGGDEWLTIKSDLPFESITMQTYHESREQAESRLLETVRAIQLATREQCKELKYHLALKQESDGEREEDDGEEKSGDGEDDEPVLPVAVGETLEPGDLIRVYAPHRPAYPLNGCRGTFLRYSDPRIGHDARSAIIHLNGEPELSVRYVIPSYLQPEPEQTPRFTALDSTLWRLTRESEEAAYRAGRFHPARVLEYRLTADGRRFRATLGAGRQDDVEVCTDGQLAYVLVVNSRLGSAGVETFSEGRVVDEFFLQGGEVGRFLGQDFWDLAPLAMAERIVPGGYCPPPSQVDEDGEESGQQEEDADADFERFEHLGTWSRDGFRLDLYGTRQLDRHGKAILGYELRDEQNGDEPVFRGADFHASPLHSIDSDATVAALLNFLSLRPGDTDAEHFDAYTPQQLEWCEQRGEELSLVAQDYSWRHHWRELHQNGHTEDAVLAVARHGRPDDLFEVLDMDVFEAYVVVTDLEGKIDDPAELRVLSMEVLRRKNRELLGE